MTENDRNHEEIARRLRDTGLVEAPERLRPDVMRHVRAEPRPRRARRPILRPLLPYAVAACLIVGIGFALSHAHGGGGSASGGGGSAALTAEAGGAQAPGSPKASRSPRPNLGHGYSDRVQGQAVRVPSRDLYGLPSVGRGPARGVLGLTNESVLSRGRVLDVPRPLYAAILKQLRFAEVHARGRPTVTVVLRPTPLGR